MHNINGEYNNKWIYTWIKRDLWICFLLFLSSEFWLTELQTTDCLSNSKISSIFNPSLLFIRIHLCLMVYVIKIVCYLPQWRSSIKHKVRSTYSILQLSWVSWTPEETHTRQSKGSSWHNPPPPPRWTPWKRSEDDTEFTLIFDFLVIQVLLRQGGSGVEGLCSTSRTSESFIGLQLMIINITDNDGM